MNLKQALSVHFDRMRDMGEINEFMGSAAEILGLEKHDINPVSSHCRVVLEKPIEEVCNNFREIRRWVLCRAWEIVDTKNEPFGEALSQAWTEIKSACGEV